MHDPIDAVPDLAPGAPVPRYALFGHPVDRSLSPRIHP